MPTNKSGRHFVGQPQRKDPVGLCFWLQKYGLVSIAMCERSVSQDETDACVMIVAENPTALLEAAAAYW